MPDSTLISSFSTAPSRACSYKVSFCSNSFFLQTSQLTFFATLPYRLFHFFWAHFSHSLVMYRTLSLFSHTIYTGGFHWSYQCFTSSSLDWLPASVRHTTMLLFEPLNHFLITIITFFLYQLSPSFSWWIASALVFHSTPLLFLFFKLYSQYSYSRINCLSCWYPSNKVFVRVSKIEP